MKSANGGISFTSINSTPNSVQQKYLKFYLQNNIKLTCSFLCWHKRVISDGLENINSNIQYYTLIHTLIPKDCILVATSLPIRPSPMIASVLPNTSTPMYFLRSQRPSLRLMCAWGRCRDNASTMLHVSSTALRVLPLGVLLKST